MTTTSTQITLPLSALRLDEKANVRIQGRGVDPILKASIKAIGLRVPLSVRKNGKGFIVIDGGQRLAALQSLHADGEFADNVDIPVVISDENDAGAREVSLALNFARSEMHQVDEYKAFAALHNDKDNPQTVEAIAKRFGIEPKRVQQRLALGSLDDSVLEAFATEQINVDAIRAFTLAPSKKAQKDVLAKLLNGQHHINGYSVRRALGLTDDSAGKFLDLVGEENYIKRGGKVTKDLFGSDHVISDPGLMTLMVDEVIRAKVEELEKDGWLWATSVIPDDLWSHPRLDLQGKPTKAEAKQLKEWQETMENEELEQNVVDAASEAHDQLEAAINARALTPEIKAKAGCFVSVHHNGKTLELDYRTKPKAAAGTTKAAAEKEKAKAAKKAAPEDTVSQALMVRLAEQLTTATQATIANQSHVALAALIAALSTHEDTVGIKGKSIDFSKRASIPEFDATLQAALKLTTAKQIEVLTAHVSRAVNLIDRSGRTVALENPHHKALAEAVDGKKLTAALREKFDAKDYFASMSRAAIVEAVREAMGDDHASSVAKMDKAAAAKFAVVNLPKVKWLPKQLRVSAYDGPAKKAAPKKAAAKKAKR